MAIREELREIVGGGGLVEPDDSARFIHDWYGRFTGPAAAVVRPSSTSEVSSVVELCHRRDIAVVPQGGRTGLCGGSVPLAADNPQARDCIIVSLERMKSVISISSEAATLTTEAGVTIQELQEEAAREGLLFAPDWGARGSAQIGGAISTNAGGLNVLRWGTMREQVLGLEVVLADGRIWDGMRSLRKDSTGVDLKQLFIGSEGTLGIVTTAVLRLHPLPIVHRSAFLALTSLDALLPLFESARGHVSAFELIPEEGVKRVVDRLRSVNRPLDRIADWYVLLRFSGDDQVEDALTGFLSSAADAGQIIDAAVAATADHELNLWRIREEIPAPFSFDARGNRHKFDIAVPVDRITDFLRRSGDEVASVVPGTRTYAFGHVGDGNLHFNIYPGPRCDAADFDRRGAELEAAIDRLTWSLGGTISAEHGIGQAMRERIRGQKSETEFDLMRTIKTALDPTDLLNPGKVLPEEPK